MGNVLGLGFKDPVLGRRPRAVFGEEKAVIAVVFVVVVLDGFVGALEQVLGVLGFTSGPRGEDGDIVDPKTFLVQVTRLNWGFVLSHVHKDKTTVEIKKNQAGCKARGRGYLAGKEGTGCHAGSQPHKVGNRASRDDMMGRHDQTTGA